MSKRIVSVTLSLVLLASLFAACAPAAARSPNLFLTLSIGKSSKPPASSVRSHHGRPTPTRIAQPAPQPFALQPRLVKTQPSLAATPTLQWISSDSYFHPFHETEFRFPETDGCPRSPIVGDLGYSSTQRISSSAPRRSYLSV